VSVTTTIEHVVDIDAEPETVYRMWTTVEGLCSWWGQSATVDARPGGSIRVDINGEHVMVGEFIELAPPHRVRFSFGWTNDDPPAGTTQVDVRIDANGAGTRLTLRHTGLPVEQIAGHAEGWSFFLGERLGEMGA
jgi:uncharacterized protein YndB with AHSA1/START domain